jgi:hypothetical protein
MSKLFALIGGRTNMKRHETTVDVTPTLGGFYKPKKCKRSKKTKKSKTYSRKNKKRRTMKK